MNYQAGDTAIIIKGNHSGAIGEVPHDAPRFLGRWFCKFPRPIKDAHGVLCTVLAVRDDWLRPVSGIPDAAIDSQSVGGVAGC